jgi:HTH-type transcriptional regulator/antitoxin HigA
METTITKTEFQEAEKKMEKFLNIATTKGGFEFLTAKEQKELTAVTAIVKAYEDTHFHIPMPETLQGLLELKMFEKKLKQKDLAKMLNTTDTQLSEIMHSKRKPTISFLKALNQVLGIDGNLLLRLV